MRGFRSLVRVGGRSVPCPRRAAPRPAAPGPGGGTPARPARCPAAPSSPPAGHASGPGEEVWVLEVEAGQAGGTERVKL